MDFKKQLTRYENKIQNIITELEITKEVSNIYYSKRISKLNKYFDELRIIFNKAFKPNVEKAYDKNIRDQIARIKGLQFNFSEKIKTRINNIGYRKYLNSDFSKRRFKDILSDGVSSFSRGVEEGKKTLLRLVNITQQINISEDKINKLIAQGFIEKGSVNASSMNLRKELLKKAKDGNIITIIDKNGKPRNYKVKDYAEMVTRTKTINAAAQSTIDIAQTVGSDLVQLSSHNTNCPICAPVEGKIYSITGADPDFPRLTFEVPLHPNCEHSLTVVFREMLEQRGIQKYIDFANNKTDVHPTLTQYKPVKDRKLA